MILGLLILVIVAMVIYFKFAHGPAYEIGNGESDIEPPWWQWKNIQLRVHRQTVGTVSEFQPQITKPLFVAAKTWQQDKEQGKITVYLLPEGKVKGGWSGAFHINKDIDYQVIMCDFKGLYDPKAVFCDEQGEDPTKLFFIAKGHYMILETNDKTGKVRNIVGDAYARGWVGTDYFVEGELIITPDNKNFLRYIWQGEAIEADPYLLY